MDTNQKGAIAEAAIALEAAKLGIPVLKPVAEHCRYDLALEIDRKIVRVQCKWAAQRGDVIEVRTSSSWYSPGRGYVVRSYTASEVDAIAAYCPDNGNCYLIPISRVGGQAHCSLRVVPTRNGQRAAINSASEYLLGAIAQLEERPDGIRKAEGSSPSSSIPQEAVAIVGAHEFRNHFGYYMERAAAGDEIRVTRRGRPYVRLVAPAGDFA